MAFKVSTGPVLKKDLEKALDALDHGVHPSHRKLLPSGGEERVTLKNDPHTLHADKLLDAARNSAMELAGEEDEGAVNVTIEDSGQSISVTVSAAAVPAQPATQGKKSDEPKPSDDADEAEKSDEPKPSDDADEARKKILKKR